MNKIVIVINGAGGVGKDTICDLAARHFKVRNISSVDFQVFIDHTPVYTAVVIRDCIFKRCLKHIAPPFLSD